MHEEAKYAVELIPLALIDPDPNNRKQIDPVEEERRTANIAAVGLLEPVIVYEVPAADKGAKRYMTVEGHGRIRSFKALGKEKIPACVLAKPPTPGQAALIRASVERFRQARKPSEKIALAAQTVELNGWTVTEAARVLGYENASPVSKGVKIHKDGTESLKRRMDDGGVNLEGAYKIAHKPADVQDRIAAMPVIPKGDNLTALLERDGVTEAKPNVKTRSLKLVLPPGDIAITVKGPEFDLPTLLDWLGEAIRQTRAADRKGHTTRSIGLYLRNTCKAVVASK